MIDTVEYKGRLYPEFQTQGNASQFAIPFALHVCAGEGYDIGCMKPEWSFPGSTPIDLDFDDPWDADNLPDGQVDYIFSSHCLEHVDNWSKTLLYWGKKIKSGGSIFLYLPHPDQEYWRPWNNTKHKHMLDPNWIKDLLEDNGFVKVFAGRKDLNDSFMVMGEKA